MENNDLQEKKSKVYELGYLLVPTIAEEQVAGEVQTIKAVLEKFDVSPITEDFPKLRPLAYNMVKASGGQSHKYDKAYFGWIKFEVNALAISQIKAELDKNDHLLRFMLINTVRENTMVMQKMVFKPTSDSKKTDETSTEPKMTAEELDKSIDSLVVE